MGLLSKKKLKPAVVAKRTNGKPPAVDSKKYPSVGKVPQKSYAGRS